MMKLNQIQWICKRGKGSRELQLVPLAIQFCPIIYWVTYVAPKWSESEIKRKWQGQPGFYWMRENSYFSGKTGWWQFWLIGKMNWMWHQLAVVEVFGTGHCSESWMWLQCQEQAFGGCCIVHVDGCLLLHGTGGPGCMWSFPVLVLQFDHGGRLCCCRASPRSR